VCVGPKKIVRVFSLIHSVSGAEIPERRTVETRGETRDQKILMMHQILMIIEPPTKVLRYMIEMFRESWQPDSLLYICHQELGGANGTVRIVHALVRATHVEVLRRVAIVHVADPVLCVSVELRFCWRQKVVIRNFLWTYHEAFTFWSSKVLPPVQNKGLYLENS